MQVTVSKGHGLFFVRVTKETAGDDESRAYFFSPTRAECDATAERLRRDIARHGSDVIVFTNYPIVTKALSRTGRVVWEVC